MILGCDNCANLIGRFHCGVCGANGGRSVATNVIAPMPKNRPELLEQPPQSSMIVVFGGRAAWQIPSDEVQYVGEDERRAEDGWRRVMGIWLPPRES